MILVSTTLLSIHTFVTPVGIAYAETFPQKQAISDKQDELPSIVNYLEEKTESKPRFFSTRSNTQGVVNETINVVFFSDQEVLEARVSLPEEATLVTEKLPAGITVEKTAEIHERLIRSERPQKTFALPLVFQEPGKFEVVLEEGKTVLEILPAQEASDSEPTDQEESENSDDNRETAEEKDVDADEEEAVEEAIEEESTDHEVKGSQDETERSEDVAANQADFLGETVEATTFEELRLAVANPEVGTIEVRNHLTRSGTGIATAIGSVDRNLLIKGNGFTINFGADNGSLDLASLAEGTQATVRLENATITKTGVAPLFNASGTGSGWTLELEGITEGTANAARLASIPEGSVSFTGGINSFVRTNDSNVFLQAKQIEVRGGAQVTINRGNATVFYSVAAIAQPELILKEESRVSITTASGTSTPVDLRGDNGKIRIDEGASLNVQTQGTTAGPTNTTNNAIVMTGSNPKVSIRNKSGLQVTTTNAKRGIHLSGDNAELDVIDSELSVTSATQAAINLVGATPLINYENSTIALKSTTGQRMTLNGQNPTVTATNSQLTMDATTGLGIYLVGISPNLVLTKSTVTVTDSGASQAVLLAGTDALFSLRENSEVSVTGGGAGTTQNIAIGNNNARPELSITGGSKLSVTTPSGTTAASDTANNAIHLRGIEPKVEFNDAEINVEIRSGARRGLFLNGATSDLSISNSKIKMKTVSDANIQIIGADADISITDESDLTLISNGPNMQINSVNGNVRFLKSKAEFDSLDGHNLNFLAADMNLVIDDGSNVVAKTSGRNNNLLFSATNPSFSVKGGSILETSTGTDASIRFLIGNSDFLVSGIGTKVRSSSAVSFLSNSDALGTIAFGNESGSVITRERTLSVVDQAELEVVNSGTGQAISSNGGLLDIAVSNNAKLKVDSRTVHEAWSSIASYRGWLRMSIANKGVLQLDNNGQGAALYGMNDITLDVTNSGSLKLDSGTTRGLVFGLNTVNVTLDSPEEVDLKARSGTHIFTSTRGTLEAKNMRLGLWRNVSDWNNYPNRFWEKMDFTMSGPNFNTLLNTNNLEFNTSNESLGNQGLMNWSRLTNYLDGSENVLPVDPLDPETEVDPENKPELPEDQGLLSIDFVSQFQFGAQAISSQDQTYYAQPQRLLNPDGTVNTEEQRPNYVQISDRRNTDARNGWQLAVTQKEQFASKTGHTLEGASLRLMNQQAVTAQGGEAPSLQVTNPLTLVPGNKRTLIRAEGTEGQGTWIYRFGDGQSAGESVALEIPKGTSAEATAYQTTLIWELSSVPGN